MCDYYIAVTIGPIVELMSQVTKPAALWASSFLFSEIAKSLCKQIIDDGLCSAEDIVVPYYPSDSSNTMYQTLLERNDGVGLFHDHIIFKYNPSAETGEDNAEESWSKSALERFDASKDTVLKKVAARFSIEDEEYLKRYVMISFCGSNVPDEKNPILFFSQMFDSMELQKTFPVSENKNEIISAFTNDKVRKYASPDEDSGKRGYLNISREAWKLLYYDKIPAADNDNLEQVKEENGKKYKFDSKTGKIRKGWMIRELSNIAAACGAEEYKKSKYYCILRADGDNMSKIISSLSSEVDANAGTIAQACRNFSKVCLDYCSEVAKKVSEFGGVPVFAGGDDLFALVPCEYNGKSVFTLLNDIQAVFSDKFKSYIDFISEHPDKYDAKPTLSFGLFISYVKFPLYEAVERSAQLLFGISKHKNGKNCSTVCLQKHAGQTEELVIPNEHLKKFEDQLQKILNSAKQNKDENKDILLSAAQKILLFNALINSVQNFDEPKKTEAIKNLFDNIFDSSYHQGSVSEYLHKELPDFFAECFFANGICAVEKGKILEKDAKILEKNATAALGRTLRLMKFFIEKGDETNG